MNKIFYIDFDENFNLLCVVIVCLTHYLVIRLFRFLFMYVFYKLMFNSIKNLDFLHLVCGIYHSFLAVVFTKLNFALQFIFMPCHSINRFCFSLVK
jgi:hypothetical protein